MLRCSDNCDISATFVNNVYQKAGATYSAIGGPRQYIGNMDDSGGARGDVHTLRGACTTNPFPQQM